MGATLTNQFALYREHYKENIAEIFFSSKKLTSPILAAMESKSEDDGMGRGFIIPTIHRLTGAVGSTLSRAQTKARSSETGNTFGSERWVVQAVKMHGVATFHHDSILAAKGDSDKLFDVIKKSMDSATAQIRKRMAHYVSGAGWGKVATVLALSTTTVTVDPALCNRLQEGDYLVACQSESGAVIKAIGGDNETMITAINRQTGVLTVDQDPTAGTPWVVGDTIFRAGDREDSASPTRQVICGLDGWFGTDTTLFGVTRTSAADLTAHQIDGAGKDHATASVEALRTLYSYDSYGSAQYVSPVDYETISLDKDAVKVVSMDVGKYKMGFEGLMASWSGYSIPILTDAMVDPGKSYVGPFDDSDVAPYFVHNDDLINVTDVDGLTIRAVDGTENFEARLFSRGNIVCPGPGKFARISSFGL